MITRWTRCFDNVVRGSIYQCCPTLAGMLLWRKGGLQFGRDSLIPYPVLSATVIASHNG
jgi:hypothetical protein